MFVNKLYATCASVRIGESVLIAIAHDDLELLVRLLK